MRTIVLTLNLLQNIKVFNLQFRQNVQIFFTFSSCNNCIPVNIFAQTLRHSTDFEPVHGIASPKCLCNILFDMSNVRKPPTIVTYILTYNEIVHLLWECQNSIPLTVDQSSLNPYTPLVNTWHPVTISAKPHTKVPTHYSKFNEICLQKWAVVKIKEKCK